MTYISADTFHRSIKTLPKLYIIFIDEGVFLVTENIFGCVIYRLDEPITKSSDK